ncbi:MAG: hypothetical protein D3916_05530, partial [Candidatus Electrothrix sp. MAN1_4]|nr:hypothetical protein [Candidatus Electrothrix sp. MAN1_4]
MDSKVVDVCFATLLLVFCLVVALTLPVNCFPEDGWFHTQYYLFGRFPGGESYAPIAAPAFLYAAIHLLATLFGLDLASEFYMGSLAHSLLLFLSGLCIYHSCKMLRCKYIGILLTGITVFFVASTFLTIAFWSENITFFLSSATIFVICKIYTERSLPFITVFKLCFLLGIIVGTHSSTRVIPIISLPALIFFFWFQLDDSRRNRCIKILTFAVLVIVISSMMSNYFRFGRFELSNTTGRHLWQGIKDHSDILLSGSPDYQIIKKNIPDIQGKNHWEINLEQVHHFNDLSKEKLLKKLSFDAIFKHPVMYIQIGIDKLRSNLNVSPGQLGLHKGPMNYLQRNEMLPPLLSFQSHLYVQNFLTRFYFAGKKVFSLINFISLYIAVTFLLIVFATSYGTRKLCLIKSLQSELPDQIFPGCVLLAISEAVLIFMGYFFRISASSFVIYAILLIIIWCGVVYKGIASKISFHEAIKNYKHFIPVLFLFLYLYVASVYLIFQVEITIPRYLISYTPFLVVMACLSTKIFLSLTVPTSFKDDFKQMAHTKRISTPTQRIYVFAFGTLLWYGFHHAATLFQGPSMWWLRLDDNNRAKLTFPFNNQEMVRVLIKNNKKNGISKTKKPWDVQLNQRYLSVKAGQEYTVAFRSRAERSRAINVAFSKSHDPWDGLGLYQTIELTQPN